METKIYKVFFLVIGILSGVYAAYLAPTEASALLEYKGGLDTAADGGALGFALLSGICFMCITILLIKEKKS